MNKNEPCKFPYGQHFPSAGAGGGRCTEEGTGALACRSQRRAHVPVGTRRSRKESRQREENAGRWECCGRSASVKGNGEGRREFTRQQKIGCFLQNDL